MSHRVSLALALFAAPACGMVHLDGKPVGPATPGGGGTSAIDSATSGGSGAAARCANGKHYVLGAPHQLPGHGVHSVRVADVNGDGKLDLVTGNPEAKQPPPHKSSFGVMLGDGAGHFGEMALTAIGGDPSKGLFTEAEVIAVGDLDGDGRPDVVYSSPSTYGTDPGYSPSIGDGHFAEQISLHSGDTAGPELIADFNGDQTNDILISSSLSVLFVNTGGKGAAKFAKGTEIHLDEYDRLAAIGDFNGDGAPDLVATNGTNEGGVKVYTNDGGGGFAKTAKVSISDVAMALVADFDGDGKPDIAPIVVVDDHISVGTLINKGTTFVAGPYAVYDSEDKPYRAIATDLDGDGKADVVISLPDKVLVFMNTGDGKLGKPTVLPGATGGDLAAGDFTGQHAQSLVIAVARRSGDEDTSHVDVFPGQCR